MTHEKLVAGTESPTRYTKIIRNPGAGTKYNRTYQETDYVSRYTKTVAGGKDYVPPAPPEPEYEELAVAPNGGANLVGSNVYEIGQEVTAKTAIFTGGNPETTTYRSRWQWKKLSSDAWENSNWMNTTNDKNDHAYFIAKPGLIRFQSQARDTSQDPVLQINSFTTTKEIPFREIGTVSLTVDDTPVVYGEPIHVAVNTPVQAVVTITGDAQPTYKWEARGNYPIVVASQTATTTLTFPEEGGPTVTLSISDSTATDSRLSYAMNFYVASQTEWDILHPTTKTN